MDKDTRALISLGIEALQTRTNDSCIAVIAGPDFCTLVHAGSFERIWERIIESAPDHQGGDDETQT